MGIVAAVMANDYKSARSFAEALRVAAKLYPPGTVSQGVDILTGMEVELVWGKCVALLRYLLVDCTRP